MHIGDGAIIGLGSVVGSDVEPYTIVAGNPARPIRKRFDDDMIDLLLRLQWWDKEIDDIQQLIPLLTDSNIEYVKETLIMQNKRLQDMTLEELWELFPIVLAPHNPKWAIYAKEEMRLLSDLLLSYDPIINHIGSTAIKSIQAKPIIDILVELSSGIGWILIKDVMENNGYICMSESDSRISFNKGYTPAGYAKKVFHIHFHRIGDNDEILFRDYLIAHPEAAEEYERLKLSLLPKYKNDRDGYTEAKTAFVKAIVCLAKKRQ